MEKRKSYVYKITCNITGEFYFGSSFRAKWPTYYGGGSKIKERIRQYGKENFTKEILNEFDDRVEAHKKENEYIEQYKDDKNCLNIRLEHKFNLYNYNSRRKISLSHKGKHLSESHKDLIRKSCVGINHGENHPMFGIKGNKHPNFGRHWTLNEESRKHISEGMKGINKGKHLSEETRKKLSQLNRGKHVPEETRLKISNSSKGKIFSEITCNKIKKHWDLVKSGKRYHKGYTEKHFPELVDILKSQKLDC